MARRGGRRGRRSRSKQRSKGAGSRSSKAKSNKSRSRNTRGSGARKSRPTKRRNTRSTTRSRASNRRANVSKARRAAPKRAAAPKKKAPTRRTPTKNKRGSGISQKRKNIGTKIGTTVKNTAKKVASTVGRVTRPPSARAKTVTSTRQAAFNKQLSDIQKRFPGASPNSAIFGMSEAQLSQPGGPFAQPGPGGPEKEADYTSYQPGSFYNQSDTNVNPTNIGRAVRDVVTSPFRALGINNQFTNKLIPKGDEAIQGGIDNRSKYNVANKPRPTRPRKMGGSKRPIAVHSDPPRPPIGGMLGSIVSAALDVLPRPAGSGISNTGEDNLTRIQNQAYSTALSNNMAGLSGDFDFGPQGSQMSISEAPGLQAGQFRGRRRIRRFNRGRRRGAGDSFRRGGRRIQEFTSTQLNI